MTRTGEDNEQSYLDADQFDGLVAAAGIDGAREILVAFWRSTDKLLAELRDQLSHGDLGGAARTAHALKGSALNVGATQLSLAIRAVEEACKVRDISAAVTRLPETRAQYARTIAAYNAHLARKG